MRIWNEAYRPKKLDDVLMPPSTREAFQSYIKNGLPNVIFSGSPGTGKTTTALILINELGAEHLRLNGSDDRGIDVIRNEIKNFIQTRSFNKKRKVVFYDESEALSPDAMKALKEITERYHNTTSFIFCTNHLFKFSEAIRSRCTIFEFKQPTKEEVIKLLRRVLEQEQVEFEPETLDKVYRACGGDMRRALNHLQRYSMSGKLVVPDESFAEIYKLIKAGNIVDIKKYFASNSVDFDGLYRFLFERTESPEVAILLGKYAYQSQLCIDKEINVIAFCAELIKLKNSK